jgi:membrane protease YdiL (CAAX protease family)
VLLAVAGRTRRWAAISAAGLSAAGGVALAVRYGDALLSRSDFMYTTLIAGALVVAALGALQLVRLVRADEPGDPVVVAAVQIGVGLVANWAYFAPALFPLDPRNYHTVNWASPFIAELPLLALALAAVGLGVTRDWKPALQRLGVFRPAWWQPFLGILVACLFLMLVPLENHLTFTLTRRLFYAVAFVNYYTDRGASLQVELVYAVMAGICEEALFRGVLQPRIGIVLTAILFAMIHTQYFLTPIFGTIFVHGLVLGVLRRHLNTTTAMVAHGSYDVLANFSLGTGGAAVVGVLMVAVLAVPAVIHRDAIWSSVREKFADDWSGFWWRRGRLLSQPLT